MSENWKELTHLPKVEAGGDFEARLYGDALAQMNLPPSRESREDQAVFHKSAGIWASLAMAASLSFGLWLGWESALSGADEWAELDVYGDGFWEQSL